MIKNNIKFTTTSQFIIFHNICSKVSSDVQIRDISNHNKPVDGKKLSELANIQLGLPALLMIHGNDEVQVFSSLQKLSLIHISCSGTIVISVMPISFNTRVTGTSPEPFNGLYTSFNPALLHKPGRT